MSDLVTVTIVGEQLLRYRQTKQMPKEEFERINQMLNSEDRNEVRKANELIGDLWIDTNDVFDSDDFEIEDLNLDEMP